MSCALQEPDRSRAIVRQAASISAAVAPFGLVFGVTAAHAGLRLVEAAGFSVFVFAGSAQFAAVETLGNGGAVLAAIASGCLLNLRSLAFGIVMAPSLKGPRWRRALQAQLMIDEATAVGLAQEGPHWRRRGYLAAGIGVFVTWNVATVVGFLALSSTGDLVERLGLDAAGPAAFLALVWPRLARSRQRACAAAGALVALALLPIAPPGIPIVASLAGVLAARWTWPHRERPASEGVDPTEPGRRS
ncbi:MAG: AzlC family ABC transporter permease [Acidimicrobiia bacterium]|nr:AzlC family ABC transporter permease [Acidimicrobiia bacterium]